MIASGSGYKHHTSKESGSTSSSTSSSSSSSSSSKEEVEEAQPEDEDDDEERFLNEDGRVSDDDDEDDDSDDSDAESDDGVTGGDNQSVILESESEHPTVAYGAVDTDFHYLGRSGSGLGDDEPSVPVKRGVVRSPLRRMALDEEVLFALVLDNDGLMQDMVRHEDWEAIASRWNSVAKAIMDNPATNTLIAVLHQVTGHGIKNTIQRRHKLTLLNVEDNLITAQAAAIEACISTAKVAALDKKITKYEHDKLVELVRLCKGYPKTNRAENKVKKTITWVTWLASGIGGLEQRWVRTRHEHNTSIHDHRECSCRTGKE